MSPKHSVAPIVFTVVFCGSLLARNRKKTMLKMARLFASLLLFASLCNCHPKSPSKVEKKERRRDEAAKTIVERDGLEARAQREAANIAAGRERLAELQQEAREKVAADLASRTDAREAKRAAILEQAAAEQARREGITAELKDFIDGLPLERSVMTGTVYLPLGGKYVQPGFVFASPAGYSVTYTKKEGDYFWFTYDEDAFALTLRKPAGGLATVEMKLKQPLVEGFQVGQTLPDFSSTKRETPSPAFKSQATPQPNLFDGRWVGTINGHAGFVEFTLVISEAGTVESDTSKLSPGGPRHATNDGKTMTWHWGVHNKEVVTFTPNPDGETALMTSKGPAIAEMGAYNASAIFHRASR